MMPLPDSQTRASAWDISYQAGDNLVFYPHEEVIRFCARFIRKRTGIHTFEDRSKDQPVQRVLILGCGIGRHIKFCSEMGLEAYGLDLSQTAIDMARGWAREYGLEDAKSRIVVGDARHLPWADNFFDACISHGVLDSMYFSIARDVMADTHRVLKPNAPFYLDVVSGDDSDHAREYCGDEVVDTQHEQNTIQCYYNYGRVEALADNHFSLEECTLIHRENVLDGRATARYHLVAKAL